MDDLKPMPEGEKFEHVFNMVHLYQKYVPLFVEEHLGADEMYSLQSIWQAGIAPVRGEDSDRDRYACAYSNWLWIAHCSHNNLADQLSSDEILQYKRMLLNLYSQTQNRTSLGILRRLKRHIPLAKALLYEMQWITPVELITCSPTQVFCIVHNCKVRQTAGTDRICRVDCQNVGSAYARQLYHIHRKTLLFEHGCQITLMPFSPPQN